MTDWPPTDQPQYLSEEIASLILGVLRSRYPGASFAVRGKEGHHLLLSALMQPQQTFEGQDLYPTCAAKAAALFYLLIKNHPLEDGNKRLATFVMAYFLDLNGYVLEASHDEITAWALWIGSCPNPSLETVTQWVLNNLKPLVR